MRFVVFLLVSALAHWFLARWVMSVWPAAERRARLVYLVAAGLVCALGGARVLAAFRGGHLVRLTMAASLIELSLVVLGLVPLFVVMLLTRGGFAVAEKVQAHKNPPPADQTEEEAEKADDAKLSRRVAVERIAGGAVFAGGSAILGWGYVRGRHAFEIEEVVVRVAGWPKALDGYTIAQVSDVHVGAFVWERELDEGFALVAKVKPDLVVATGDLVDFEPEAIRPLALRLANARARDGAVAIVGNHDHYAGPEEVVESLRAANVRVLCNQGIRLREGDGGGFALLGLTDLVGRSRPKLHHQGPDLGKALAMVPNDLPRILLAHQPIFFAESAGRVGLQLSGHTHGGQINPGFSPAGMVMRYVKGRYEENGSTLWVNRGFGVAGPPSRVGAPPEITKIVIVSG